MFSLEERQKLLSKYSRRKEDEEQNMGVVKKITHSSCFHIGQSIASYFALFAMISALIVLAYPPHFGPLVSKATEKNFPAKNPLFDKLLAAADKSELKNTEYRLAFANGKSAVRVCTDLELKTFEEHTKLTREFRMWDNMKDKAIEQFISDGCDNTTTLAFNAACNDEKGAFYTKEDSGTSIPDVTSTTEFPSRGQCGNPGSQDGVFSNPDPGRGWLWKYMVQSEVTPKDFPPDYNVTNRTCVQEACQQNPQCLDNYCLLDNANSNECQHFQRTNTCGSKNDKDGPAESCGSTQSSETNGYCDCGSNGIVWKCQDVVSVEQFKCTDVCRCFSNSTCALPNTRCNCTLSTTLIKGKPDWIENNPQYVNKNCAQYGFGTIAADKAKWVGKTIEACKQAFVHSYGLVNEQVVALFTASTILRVVLQLSCIYWAFTENDEELKIALSALTPMRIWSLCRFGKTRLNEAIDKEPITGWPWLLGLLDALLVTVATVGVAYGADPFPQLMVGYYSLLLLWITAIIEAMKLLGILYSTCKDRAWKVGNEKKLVGYCGKDLPWCCVGNAPGTNAKVVPAS